MLLKVRTPSGRICMTAWLVKLSNDDIKELENLVNEKDAVLCKIQRIMSIPCMLFFKDGQLVDRLVGAQPKAAIAAKLDSLL